MPQGRRPVRRLLGVTVLLTVIALPMLVANAQLPTYRVGRAPTPDEIAAWDLTIPPDGEGLPAGSGAAALGKAIYEKRCASCHGDAGKGRKHEEKQGKTAVHGILRNDNSRMIIRGKMLSAVP